MSPIYNLKRVIVEFGGDWPPPGTKEVAPLPNQTNKSIDWERRVRLILKQRQLLSRALNGSSLQRAAVREEIDKLETLIR